MNKYAFRSAPAAIALCLTAALPSLAAETKTPQTPAEIIAASTPDEWVTIAPEDLLVMDLAPDATGRFRRVVIQLMPAPFSQGWIGNIRKLAHAHWWDGTAIVRVQDNYVTQWGDPNGEDPAKAKKLPEGLVTVPESEYVTPVSLFPWDDREVESGSSTDTEIVLQETSPKALARDKERKSIWELEMNGTKSSKFPKGWHERDSYSGWTEIYKGWPLGGTAEVMWPTHCYGMVGVGRNLSPDTGTGAELYTVIGHAPRQLDRNIAVVGRVIEGMEYLSSLPRGTGPLGFYETPEERTEIRSVDLMSEMPTDKPLPQYEYLSTESKSFAAYVAKRANRSDDFYKVPAGGVDICNLPVPVRRKAQ